MVIGGEGKRQRTGHDTVLSGNKRQLCCSFVVLPELKSLYFLYCLEKLTVLLGLATI